MLFHRGFAWLILIGLFVAFGAPGLVRHRTHTGDQLDDFAIMGGVDRRVVTQDFRGGEALAIMGGIKLDLRDANIAGDEAVIEATSIMGGVDIFVPRDWDVRVEGMALLGGFEDRPAFRAESDGTKRPRLVVTGTAIMGGVKVHH